MKRIDFVILFLIALAFFSLLAMLQTVPGYMDAEYYYGQSVRWIEHRTLLEPFLWNYLNNPLHVSTPGFAFWLPLTAFIAAAGSWISGSTSYYAAKILFILMAASISVMAAYFANLFLPGKRAGWLAGLLAMFSGFYMPFAMTTDTFTPYMFLGGLFFVSLWKAEQNKSKKSKFIFWIILLGLVAGLMSLTRSDGLLWLVGAWLGAIMIFGIEKKILLRCLMAVGLVLAGFALVMLWWYLRNFALYNALFPAGNRLMFWLTKYDDLFVYPSSQLTFLYWSGAGIGPIVLDRIKALISNLQTLIASGGAIILFPLMVIGLWRNRKSTTVRVTFMMLAAILAVMTLVFPYAGERGGFFHSLASVQVVLWSLVPVGLETVIQWGVSHRTWKTDRSWKMFGTALVVVVGIFSTLIMIDKLTNGTESGIPWNQTQVAFISIEKTLVEKTGDQSGVIMLNNPPGYSLISDREGVMIPTGGENAILAVSQRYQVRYLAVNGERADVLDELSQSELLKANLVFLFEMAGNQVYEFKP